MSSPPSSPIPNGNNGNNGNNTNNGNNGNNTQGPNDIVNFTLNQVIDGDGTHVVNQQGQTADGKEVTHTTFVTTDLSNVDMNIQEDLTQVVESYYDDEVDPNSPTLLVLNQIKEYAKVIKCDNFKGKGTIEDYSELFEAASKIANESKQMELSVDISGFNEFGNAADELSKLFTSFIKKLENVNIINDLSFLNAIASALSKIVNLANVFGKFKETILATSTLEIPKTAHDARLVVESVVSELNCAMAYINHFVDSSQPASTEANLSAQEQNVIATAVKTIDNWNILCDQDVTVAMSNNPDVMYIKNASNGLFAKTSMLVNNTSTLRGKLAMYKVL